MDLSRLSGTPWHTEKAHREEGDDRRYKGRCKYYNYDTNDCSRRNGRCIGSAHCTEYEAISDEAFRKRQVENAKKKANQKSKKNSHSDDDVFWY